MLNHICNNHLDHMEPVKCRVCKEFSARNVQFMKRHIHVRGLEIERLIVHRV